MSARHAEPGRVKHEKRVRGKSWETTHRD
jgi:hypothetical protein